MTAIELLKEVKALPANEREKFVFALLDWAETAPSVPAKKEAHVRWPDVHERAKRIFGNRVFPNLVLLERSENGG